RAQEPVPQFVVQDQPKPSPAFAGAEDYRQCAFAVKPAAWKAAIPRAASARRSAPASALFFVGSHWTPPAPAAAQPTCSPNHAPYKNSSLPQASNYLPEL